MFRRENEDLDNCPKCGILRYKRRKDGGDDGEDIMDERKKGTPRKVAWYFPLVSKLQRMFANKKEAKLLRWHEEDIIKTQCYVILQIVLNGDILITPMAGSGMILGILGLL